MSQAEWLLLSAGLSAYLVIYNGLVWSARPRTRSLYLWIALWSACSFVYQLARHEQLSATSPEALLLADRVCLATAALLVPLIVVVVRALADDDRWPWVPRLFALVAGAVVFVHVPTQLFITSEVDHYLNFSGREIAFSRVGPLYAPTLIPLSVAALAYGVYVLHGSKRLGRAAKLSWIAACGLYQALAGNDVMLFSGLWAQVAPGRPLQSFFEFGIVAFAIVLTLRMAHRAELQHVELRQLIEQRTAELSSALARATSAAEAKSSFLAAVSHEVRTPLNGIIGLTEVILQRPLPIDLRNQLLTVQSSGATLRKLVDELLDFSKLDAKRMSLHQSRVLLPRLFEDVISLYRGMAEAKRITLDLELEQMPAVVRCDDLRLRQVLSNLVVNAIKFTERGGVRVRASMRRVGDAEIALHVEVVDSGCGIADADRDRLFLPFSQVVGVSKQPTRGGTGLGLALSRELLSLMGGTISLRSKVGEGSTFAFDVLLPVHHWDVISDDMLATGDTPRAQPRETSTPRRGGRVLVAEDNPVNRLVAIGLLKSLGYEAEAVADGQQAIEAIERDSYDLVLMDCQMPVLDGLEATRELRARGQRIPIVALTAFAGDDDRARCLTAGMDDYLAKPVTRAELEATLDRVADAVGFGR